MYTLPIYDIRKTLKMVNQLRWNLNLMESFLERIYGDGLVLTSRLISIGSDGQRMFDFNWVKTNFFITLSFFFIDNSVLFNNDSL